MLDLGFVSAVLSIVVIDLVLSGDNAVVIGMAAGRLSAANRRRAILIGGAGAVGLRMLFTVAAALLLDVPLLQAAGGLLLLWIAYRLVRPVDHAANVREADSLGQAIRTIVLADVVMSLDNILAVGGAAHGSLGLLLFGLALSIPILLLGSELMARLIGRLPILNYFGAVVLIMTAIRMVLEDEIVDDLHDAALWEHVVLTAIASAVIILAARWLYRGGRTSIEQGNKTAADPSAG
ncbi:MAG: YjbE family putative metal transport protein [Thermomicrobiales bacterium]